MYLLLLKVLIAQWCKDSLRPGRSGDRIPVGTRFVSHVQTGSGPNLRPVHWVPGRFSGVQLPGRGLDHLSQFSAEVETKVELYLYSPGSLRNLLQVELYLVRLKGLIN
jgi:hypothetical protein